jgi:hypothetical protein
MPPGAGVSGLESDGGEDDGADDRRRSRQEAEQKREAGARQT